MKLIKGKSYRFRAEGSHIAEVYKCDNNRGECLILTTSKIEEYDLVDNKIVTTYEFKGPRLIIEPAHTNTKKTTLLIAKIIVGSFLSLGVIFIYIGATAIFWKLQGIQGALIYLICISGVSLALYKLNKENYL